ncbi:MAG: aminotransferase class V-fold PLP-dependent enzyme [Planctomycetaceae bacterium]|nr:MAG: aminotransferase class V-fold PLP-dependent enzyme [Planctomycetaceae bacterium]
MPIVRDWAYLDHAAVAPLPAPTAAAIRDFADEASLAGDTVWPEWAAEVEQLRGDFATLLHTDASEVAILPNTSYGINLVAEGFPWVAGDNVVIPADEFPSNVFPWQNQARRGVALRIVPNRPDGSVDLSAILAAIDNRTRIVAASWVGFASGYRLDLAEAVAAVHAAGPLFFLDAIQGLGVFPLDLQRVPVDFLAADGHKWLLGPEGAGVAVIRKPHLERLTVAPVGWNSVRGAYRFGQAELDLKPDASRFEIGSTNMLGCRALRQSLSIFLRLREALGEAAIADRVLDLAEELDEKLRNAGATTATAPRRQNRSGIVTFAPANLSAARFRSLAAERGIAVSCRGIGVRASIHAYNNSSDIDRLLAIDTARQPN